MSSQDQALDEKHSPRQVGDEAKPTSLHSMISTSNDESRDETIIPVPNNGLLDSTVEPTSESPPVQTELHSVFSISQQRMIILAGSFAAFFSPLSSSIYFPALTTIAEDLNVTESKISLTVTTYLIIQGLAPMMIAGFSDSAGRRPAYFLCATIYIAANIGLSLQNSYAALLVLRCLQSGGSSGTVALANGMVGDLVTSSERGKYIAFASLGTMLGPSLSPIVGGLLAEYLNWHWIFWFLLILSCSFFIPLLLYLPETCRSVVGNGSIPPPKLNMSLTDYFRYRKRAKTGIEIDTTKQQELRKNYGLRFPNPLSTLVVVAHKESGILLFTTGLGLACYYALSTAASDQFTSTYGFNSLQVGLMFIPVGAGSVFSAFTTGKIIDWNYRRYAKKHGLPMTKNVQQDLSNFPIERARLEVAFPFMFAAGIGVIAYGWILEKKVDLAGPIVFLFFMGWTLTSSNQVLNVLMVDIYPGKPATATAANNLVRCELGAASSAAIVPMINAMGSGWSFTLLGLLFLAATPSLFYIMQNGIKWRQAQKIKGTAKAAQKLEKAAQKERVRQQTGKD